MASSSLASLSHEEFNKNMVIKSRQLWDARLPPVKKHTIQGVLVPTEGPPPYFIRTRVLPGL